MKTPIVFSVLRDQSIFMTAIMAVLTFLSVMALGVAISIGTGVLRWNAQWENVATIQVTNKTNIDNVNQILKTNAPKIKSSSEISNDKMIELMRPWMSGGDGALKEYLPHMWEVTFTSQSDMRDVTKAVSQYGRVLTHASALKSPIAAGWRLMAISGLILLMMLGAITVCVSYIARNIALLHRRELEILNQIGARDTFVARQMQIIVGRICVSACTGGFIVAVPILLIIISAAHSARVGLMAMIGISGLGWLILAMLPAFILIFAIWITGRTTIKVLENS